MDIRNLLSKIQRAKSIIAMLFQLVIITVKIDSKINFSDLLAIPSEDVGNGTLAAHFDFSKTYFSAV